MSLPTLYINGLFEFVKDANLINYDKELLKLKPVEIVCEIFKNKFKLTGTKNRVSILISGTGSGKSTVLPPEIYNNVLDERAVLFTEPRINLCDNAANDILNYHKDWSYGKEIAIHTGNKVIRSSENKFMEFATTQVLQNFLQQLLETENINLLNRYQIIVVDEAHILEIQTISVISTIKLILDKFGDRKECPLFVFASATIEPTNLLNYFHLTDDLKYTLLTVKGVPNFPINEIILTEDLIKDLNTRRMDIYDIVGEEFVKQVFPMLDKSNSFVKIMDKEIQCRDVLIFVPGVRAIEIACKKINSLINNSFLLTRETKRNDLEKWRKANNGKKRILIMGYSASFSSLSLELLEKPFENDLDVLENETKIIVSTSVIETGKTIKTLLFCIDIGFNTKTIYNPLIYKFGMNFLIQTPENKSQRIQRRGRVGRGSEGFYLQFFSKEVYEKMDNSDIPETVNMCCLSNLIYSTQLKSKKKQIFDIANLNEYLYPIPPDLMIKSLNDLFFANLIGSNGEWLDENIDEQWIIYARLAYYILKMPLYLSIMLASINRYNLPPLYQVKDFSLDTYPIVFKYTFEKIIEEKYLKAIDFIPSGRKLFIDIVEGKNKTIIPYRKDLF